VVLCVTAIGWLEYGRRYAGSSSLAILRICHTYASRNNSSKERTGVPALSFLNRYEDKRVISLRFDQG
jgi:hypothetical protein